MPAVAIFIISLVAGLLSMTVLSLYKWTLKQIVKEGK